MDKSQNNKTIIIKGKGFINFDGVDDVYTCYSSYGLVSRVMRRLTRTLEFHCLDAIIYGEWKKRLKSIDTVIIFDCGVGSVDRIVNYIKHVNPKIRIVFWYWNPVNPNDGIPNNDAIDEIWTYNRFDAKKYGLRYNPQFYYMPSVPVKPNDGSDIVFVGTNKGREQILSDIDKKARKQGLNCKIHIVESKKDSVKYTDYLSGVAASKCVIDLVPDQFCGLTLRPLEALFFKKKLITNYEDIVNYSFYNKANIFLLGKDNINNLAEFVNSPYKEVKKEIVDYYSYRSWQKRIERGESLKP